MTQHIDSREILELASYLCRFVASGRYDVLTDRNATQLVALGEALQARLPLGTSIRPHDGSLPHFQQGGKEHLPLKPSNRPERIETMLKRLLGARPGKETTEARAAAIRLIEESE
jgi:hypothetical protein